MSFLTKIVLCMWGHDYKRHGDYLVCEACGDKIRVKGGLTNDR